MIAANPIQNTKLSDFFIDDEKTDYQTVPDAILTYTRDTVFGAWQSLERQLEQVDPIRDPDVYRALDIRAGALYQAWVCFRICEDGGL